MASLYTTARVGDSGELIISKEILEEIGVGPGDEIEISVSQYRPSGDESINGNIDKSKTLADLLEGYIGGFKSGRGEERLSENCGEKFADYLVGKHREGHL